MGVPYWLIRLRIWHCHCYCLGHCCGIGSVLGTSACHGCSQKKKEKNPFICLFVCLFCFVFGLFAISWAAPEACGGYQAGVRIGAVAAGLLQSHSNVGSKLHL